MSKELPVSSDILLVVGGDTDHGRNMGKPEPKKVLPQSQEGHKGKPV